MNRISIVLFFLIFVINTVLPSEVRDFRLENLKGKVVKYSEIKGENITIIDFWATWCKPCRSSIPKLVELSKRYRDKGVEFIGISVDGPRNLSKVAPVAKSLGIQYPVLLDINGKIMSEMNVTAVPSLLIVNKENKVVNIYRGYRPGDEEVLETEIQKLLNTKLEKQHDAK
jgi:thiol-disulfide isomerase/thioredoxin